LINTIGKEPEYMNPYKIDGPAVISFSGGRTSGFMLAKIVETHGGTLPDDVHVVFANTGLEHAATYDFVQKVSDNIAPVTWVEYTETDGKKDYKTVDYSTCSRNGEPMSMLIQRKSFLPNPVTRFCTAECKIKTIERFCKRTLGFDFWTEVIGLRADEPRRVAKLRSDNNRDTFAPIAQAGHTIEDVVEFWQRNSFDLELPYDNNSFGNCVGCFLKGTPKLIYVFEKAPEYAQWWIDQETNTGFSKDGVATFRKDRAPYRQLLEMAQSQQTLDFCMDDVQECSCTD
jgi:3'-phosphoadenosine 5'-phosphosulfate sulfotransferase (PAPS reductase)/FAD synthetase